MASRSARGLEASLRRQLQGRELPAEAPNPANSVHGECWRIYNERVALRGHRQDQLAGWQSRGVRHRRRSHGRRQGPNLWLAVQEGVQYRDRRLAGSCDEDSIGSRTVRLSATLLLVTP